MERFEETIEFLKVLEEEIKKLNQKKWKFLKN